MIRLTQLSKRFGNFLAVDSISLNVSPGSIFAFLGTNGAGKTTTIRMMTGILKPTSGRAEIGGYDIATNPQEAKFLMGVIPDRPFLYGKLTGLEFLQFMGDLYKMNRKEANARIAALLEQYGLSEWQHELIDSYSHGMKQRLMMCGSQVHSPRVLIIDEPMVGLDPKAAKLFKENLKESARLGLTIFMSTHSLSVAEEISDSLAIIQHGRIIAHGDLQELYAKARTDANDLERVFLDIISEEDSLEPGAQARRWGAQ